MARSIGRDAPSCARLDGRVRHVAADRRAARLARRASASPGIGKSRLARELAPGASATRATVLEGRCPPTAMAITYWPVREMVAAGGARPAARGPDRGCRGRRCAGRRGRRRARPARGRAGRGDAVRPPAAASPRSRAQGPLVLVFEDVALGASRAARPRRRARRGAGADPAALPGPAGARATARPAGAPAPCGSAPSTRRRARACWPAAMSCRIHSVRRSPSARRQPAVPRAARRPRRRARGHARAMPPALQRCSQRASTCSARRSAAARRRRRRRRALPSRRRSGGGRRHLGRGGGAVSSARLVDRELLLPAAPDSPGSRRGASATRSCTSRLRVVAAVGARGRATSASRAGSPAFEGRVPEADARIASHLERAAEAGAGLLDPGEPRLARDARGDAPGSRRGVAHRRGDLPTRSRSSRAPTRCSRDERARAAPAARPRRRALRGRHPRRAAPRWPRQRLRSASASACPASAGAPRSSASVSTTFLHPERVDPDAALAVCSDAIDRAAPPRRPARPRPRLLPDVRARLAQGPLRARVPQRRAGGPTTRAGQAVASRSTRA